MNEVTPESDNNFDLPSSGQGSNPIDTDAIDDVLSLEDEYALGEPWLEPRRVRLPRPLIWGVLILLVLAAIILALRGFAQSTWTYATAPVGPATTARLARIHAELAAAGAPETALRYVAAAARSGINSGDAAEALASADTALEPVGDNAAIASARQELRAILGELNSQRFPWVSTGIPSGSVTPPATLIIDAP